MTHILKNVATHAVIDQIVQLPKQPGNSDCYIRSVDSVEAERVYSSSFDDN